MYRPERRPAGVENVRAGTRRHHQVRVDASGTVLCEICFQTFWKLNDLSIAFCERERIVVDFRSLATGLPFDCSRLAYYVV